MTKKKVKTKKGKKSPLKKLLLDFTPVFAGVIIALFLNNIKTRIDNHKFLNEIFASIETSTDENIETLQNQLTQNRKVADSLYKYIDNENMNLVFVFMKMGGKGINIQPLDFSAWNVLKSSPLLTKVDLKITSLQYKVEETYRMSSELITSNITILGINSKSKDEKEKIFVSISTYNSYCEEQLNLFNKIKEIIAKE